MRNLTLVVLLLFSLGCTNREPNLCTSGKIASHVLAATMASRIGCEHVDTIRRDMEKKIDDAKLCEKQYDVDADLAKVSLAEAFGQSFCEPVVHLMTVDYLFYGETKERWGCGADSELLFTRDNQSEIYALCASAF